MSDIWGIKHMKVYSFVGLYLEAHERKYVLHMSIRPWKKKLQFRSQWSQKYVIIYLYD